MTFAFKCRAVNSKGRRSTFDFRQLFYYIISKEKNSKIKRPTFALLNRGKKINKAMSP